MDYWCITNYKRPQFTGHVKKISENSLVIILNQEETEITLATPTDTHDLFEWLINKKGLFISPEIDPDWINLANELDRLGYIRELSDTRDWQSTTSSVHNLLLQTIDKHLESIRLLHQNNDRWLLVRKLLLDDLSRGVGGTNSLHFTIDSLIDENFYLSLVRVVLRSWMRTEPATLFIIKALIEGESELRTQLQQPCNIGISGLDDLYAFGLDQTIQRLSTFTELLSQVFDDDTQKILTLTPMVPEHPVTSLNAAIEFESLARQALLSIRLSGIEVVQSTTISIEAVIQQYFVDERFVETVAPAVARNLPRDFKQMFRRYLVEELGHEEFDVETAKSAGIDESELKCRKPLALTDAFCDVYVLLASDDLLAYILSIVLTEGLPSDVAKADNLPTTQDLTQLTGAEKHSAFNTLQHHQYISRWLARSAGWITPQRYASSTRIFLFLLELNHRLWWNIQRIGKADAN